jgi:hypothetical protein
LKPEFESIYSQLIETKVFFTDTDAAAKHLQTIEGSEHEWWTGSEVTAARNQMLASVAKPIKGSKVRALKKALSVHCG